MVENGEPLRDRAVEQLRARGAIVVTAETGTCDTSALSLALPIDLVRPEADLTEVLSRLTAGAQRRDVHVIVLAVGVTSATVRRGTMRFVFQTLDEAKAVARTVATLCPNPDQAICGLTELAVNAVEHGNLGIRYDEKGVLLRAGRWEREIARRLVLPENRDKFVVLEFTSRKHDILILIRDCGTGFDWHRYLDFSPERAQDVHGRGVAMARALSFDSLEYRGGGNVARCIVRRADSPWKREGGLGRR